MKRNYFWGIIFICLALASAAYAFGIYVDSSIAEFIVSIGLILMIIVSLPRRNFFVTFILLAILIILNRYSLGLYDLSFGPLIVTAILFAIGCNILFGNNRQYIHDEYKECHNEHQERKHKQKHQERMKDYANDHHHHKAIHDDDEHTYSYTNRFGEATKFIQGTDLKNINLTSDFGQLSVYFDKADFDKNGANIYCGTSFGAMTLYIPRKYNVDDQLTATLGNIKTNISDFVVEDEDVITLTLKGNVTLGEIQIIRI